LVINGIKGIETGQILTFTTPGHSCSRDGVPLDTEYYISGHINDDGDFTGEWKENEYRNSSGDF
jgi:hypothetical protein